LAGRTRTGARHPRNEWADFDGESLAARRNHTTKSRQGEHEVQRFTLQMMISLILAGCLTLSQAGPAAIGTVVANGEFRVDSAPAHGNATIVDGATIQTGAARSEVRLNNGARMSLGAGTRGRIFRDRLFLEQGEGQIEAGLNYTVEARTLKILSDDGAAHGRIALAGDRKVQVAALKGAMRVTNAAGILVARVLPGVAMEFEPQAAGAAAPSRLSGCLQKKHGRYLLTDETTKVTVALEGAALPAEVGNRVEIVGMLDPSAKPADASQLIKVSGVKRLAQGCPAKGTTAKAGAAAGGATGAATGASVAVVAGVAVAATVGGLAVAEKLPGQGDSGRPAASR
jgi:hypothetical protein